MGGLRFISFEVVRPRTDELIVSIQISGIAMALINCEECNREISDEALICPYCGITRVSASQHRSLMAQQQFQSRQRKLKIIFWLGIITPLLSLFVFSKLSTERPVGIEPSLNSSVGYPIPDACYYLHSHVGFSPSVYKKLGDISSEYSCSTPYKSIDERNGRLSNNIAHYVVGDEFKAVKLYIVLNVNTKVNLSKSINFFIDASMLLTKKAARTDLTKDIVTSIKKEKSITRKVNGNKIEVKKESWPSGDGYELQFIITPFPHG